MTDEFRIKFKIIIAPHIHSSEHVNNIAGFLSAILIGANETRKCFNVTKPIQTKLKPKDANTLQTIADLKSSKKIIDTSKLYFPNDLLFDEELGFVRLSKTSNINIGGKFYIDPLDGTEPFSRGLPFYAVGGMYYEVNKTSPLYTVICLPFLFPNFIYFAQHKAGAYKIELIEQNKFLIPGKKVVPLLISNKKHYKNPMIVIDNLWNNETQTYKSNFVNLVSKSISKWIQGIGSNLAQQALVADGKYDLSLTDCVGGGWDLSGMLLVKEAGGFVTNLRGELPVPGDELAICASSEELGRRVLKIALESYPNDWDNYGFRGKPKS